MESLLESQRNCHEERERCIDLMVKESLMEKRSQREKVNSEQRIRACLDRYQATTNKLVDLYTDGKGEREKEIQAIGGPNEFQEFYSRLKALKDFHRKNLNENARPLTVEFQEMFDYAQDPDRVEKEMVRFTDEEGYGKFLDMHVLFDQYLNLKGVKRTDYISYLSTFDHFAEIPKESKKAALYKAYLTALLDYLKDFLTRAKPLLDLDGELSASDKDFEVQWAEGKLPGWTKEKPTQPATTAAVSLDLSNYNSVEELEALGLERLKSALMALSMKCGGTLHERAERLFKTKGKENTAADPSANAKKPESEQLKEEYRQKFLAQTESQISRLAQFLEEEREGTKENVERKQARAAGEEEDEEEIEEFYQEPEEDDGSVPYNPKNLPLGWDGKPIPYWLYKLHGLNIGYSCEICGNQVYKGPKSFQRHFTEWRHSHGMRCLGIPNTAHFANVTKIDEAMELWRKLCSEKTTSRWNPEADEEYEDSQGNVVNRRTYEDLKRQGLL